MKKGFFLVALFLASFFLQGCHSNAALSRDPSGGYPVGHDLHPDTELDPDTNVYDNGGFS